MLLHLCNLFHCCMFIPYVISQLMMTWIGSKRSGKKKNKVCSKQDFLFLILHCLASVYYPQSNFLTYPSSIKVVSSSIQQATTTKPENVWFHPDVTTCIQRPAPVCVVFSMLPCPPMPAFDLCCFLLPLRHPLF